MPEDAGAGRPGLLGGVIGAIGEIRVAQPSTTDPPATSACLVKSLRLSCILSSPYSYEMSSLIPEWSATRHLGLGEGLPAMLSASADLALTSTIHALVCRCDGRGGDRGNHLGLRRVRTEPRHSPSVGVRCGRTRDS